MSSLLPPGTIVTTALAAPAVQAPTATSPWFLAGITQAGPTTPQVITSIAGYIATYGQRVSQGLVYDSLDVFFREGGQQAYVARVVGPGAAYATITATDSSSVASLVFTAKAYGTFINGYQIVITNTSGTYVVTIEDASNNVLETWPGFTTQAAAVAYSAGSSYVTATLGSSSLVPKTQTVVMAAGTDDYADATDTQWLAAINTFSSALGPGQVSMPGRSTGTAHANLIAHAVTNNRRALLDYTDTGTRATLVTAAATDTLVSGSMYAAAFAPLIVVPGLTSGTTRTVPFSALAAGLMARNDNAGVSPNQPSAGVNYGVSNYALGLSQQPWSTTAGGDQEQLNTAGVNVGLILQGSVTLYGYRTLAPPTVPADWLLLSNSRLVMAIVAQAQAIAQNFVFSQIDGQGALFANFNAELTAMLVPFYNSGALYGSTQAQAFTVNTGPNVNTPTTIANLQLCAVISLALSPDAEQVPIQIVTNTQTQGV